MSSYQALVGYVLAVDEGLRFSRHIRYAGGSGETHNKAI